jgi:hypothetical protein
VADTLRKYWGMDVMQVLVDRGMLLQSARGPVANVAEMVAGERNKGSWWAHPKSNEIFGVLNELEDSPDVVRLRLINGKVTLVHRRVWPALVRVADHLTSAQLAALHEEHTTSGRHRVVEEPFPHWVPADSAAAAAELSLDEAWEQLPDCLRTS